MKDKDPELLSFDKQKKEIQNYSEMLSLEYCKYRLSELSNQIKLGRKKWKYRSQG